MTRDFVIASNNAHKIYEFKRILTPLGYSVKSASEAGVDFSDVEETGSTFAENSRIKAMYAYKKCGLPCIADDSGLCVNALAGRPGIYSARYAGEDSSDNDKINLLLKELSDTKSTDRSAYFICSICCVFNDVDIIEVEGRCNGNIGTEKSGDNGFGYDPVFYINNGKSFAQLSADEKDIYSHRGNALRALSKELANRKDF